MLTLRRDGSVDAGAINRVLAFRVYRHLAAREPKNFVFSPLALQLTLAKLMRTLDRSDARRIARTLCLSEPPPPTFESALETQLARWQGLSARGVDLRFETRAFGTALPAALAGFESESVDPTTATGNARVKQWMQGVVGARLPTQTSDSPTVLGTALAFEGDWRTPFWRGPRTMSFQLGSGAYIRVAAYQRGSMGVWNYQALELVLLSLPYAQGELALFVAMPRKSLHEFEDELTPHHLSSWDASLILKGATSVALPKLGIRSMSNLSCCGLEWLGSRTGSLIQVVALTTRNRGGPPAGRIEWPDDPIFRNLDMLRPSLLMVRSGELILLMGRLVDPR